MGNTFYEAEEKRKPIRPSFLCNIWKCKEKTTELAPNYFLVECERCGENISLYGTFKFEMAV